MKIISTTIDEVIENLELIIQVSKPEESTTGYFAAIYRKMTRKKKTKLVSTTSIMT